MPKHKDQRVGVFIDVQNLYYSAKQFYNSKVNFAHILSRAVSNRQLIRAIAYVIKADIKEEGNFFEALEKIGYDVRAKDLQTFYGGAKKGDWDVGIAMDIMRMSSKLDVIVLVSGDGDFKDLLEHVKALGCRAEVIAFGKTSSSRLLAEADEFIDLGKELDKVLIRRDGRYNKPGSPVNGPRPVGQRPVSSRPPMKSSRPPAGKKPMYNKNKPRPSSGNRPRPRMGQRFEDRPREEPSLIQKLNMEQPELNTESHKTIKMPKPEEKAVKQQVKKTVKKKITKKPAAAKKPVKKAVPKKKESMVKKVLKKMTKKK